MTGEIKRLSILSNSKKDKKHEKRWYPTRIIDFILLIVQVLLFAGSFVAYFAFNLYLLEVILMAISLFVKIIRMYVLNKQIGNISRKVALSQIKFYTPYLLTIFEAIFYYYSQQHTPQTDSSLNMYLIFLILKNMNYSFLTHQKLTTMVETFFMSLTLVAWVCMIVQNLMNDVYSFDNQITDDYQKDLILLMLTTDIANSAMMMDLLWRPIQEVLKEKIEEQEKQQELEKNKNQKEKNEDKDKDTVKNKDETKVYHHNKKQSNRNKTLNYFPSMNRNSNYYDVSKDLKNYRKTEYQGIHQKNTISQEDDSDVLSPIRSYRKDIELSLLNGQNPKISDKREKQELKY